MTFLRARRVSNDCGPIKFHSKYKVGLKDICQSFFIVLLLSTKKPLTFFPRRIELGVY